MVDTVVRVLLDCLEMRWAISTADACNVQSKSTIRWKVKRSSWIFRPWHTCDSNHVGICESAFIIWVVPFAVDEPCADKAAGAFRGKLIHRDVSVLPSVEPARVVYCGERDVPEQRSSVATSLERERDPLQLVTRPILIVNGSDSEYTKLIFLW